VDFPQTFQLISGFFGLPMRPDFTGEAVKTGTVDWPNRSYNVNAFQVEPGYNGVWGDVIGQVGRNYLRGPGFFQWDLSMMKNFPITEKVKLQFRTDLFNILNHPNFGNPDTGICTAVAAPVTTPSPGCAPSFTDPSGQAINRSFGKVAQTIADLSGGAIGNGTSRQVQFSLKLMF
jgi:hypothetical protein